MPCDKIISINLKILICKIRGYHKTYRAVCRGEFFGYDCSTCKSRFSIDMSRIQYPRFKYIIQQCKEKMKQVFPKYGNSWAVTGFETDFWEKRLDGEIKEIFMAKDSKEFRDEIIDAMNILSMMYENAMKYKKTSALPVESEDC